MAWIAAAVLVTGVPAVALAQDQDPDQDQFETVVADGDDATTVVTFPPTLPSSWPAAPKDTARSQIAIDDVTGQVLASDEEDLRLAVASTVKLVTALTARRLYPLDRMVTAGPEALIEGSTAAIDPGDTWSVQDLLLGLLLRSGNDAAEVLAAADGDREAFIAEMNATIASLGIEGATVLDPSGLEDNNLMSARDLATIAQATLADEVLAEMVNLRAAPLPSTGVVPNRNLLLERLDNAIGLKTGTTDLAGASLVGGAVWQDRSVITVVLGAVNDDARYDETEALMRFVDDIGTVTVPAGARIRVPGRWVGERSEVTLWAPTEVVASTEVAADGSVAATAVRLDGEEVASAVMTVDPAALDVAGDGPVSMGQASAAVVYDALRQAAAVGLVPTGEAGG
ncbi:MAG TPA: serine hydrolase [Nitriliruptoraceae bacterium]|nr:serine hydrolase [Nitriliruptoraceae bacterium]